MHLSHTCGLKTLISAVAQKCHGNFNLLMAFQFVDGNFNLLMAISVYSQQFHFTHSNFNFISRQFFASLTTCQLQQPTVATKSQKTQN